MLTRNCLSLLLWVLFDGGLLTPLPPQLQQTLATEPRENVIHLPGRRLHFQRVKRGWVWNQFFVLEEYMGSEPQYVGKVMACFFWQPLDSKGSYALCIVCGCLAQEVEQTSDLNTGNDIQETCFFLPDSVTRVSFWEYNLIYLYFDYPWLIYFFFFTFFTKHKVEIYKSTFEKCYYSTS